MRRLLYRWDQRNQAWADRQNESPAPHSFLASPHWQEAYVGLVVVFTIGHVLNGNWLSAVFWGAQSIFWLAIGVYVLRTRARQRSETSRPDERADGPEDRTGQPSSVPRMETKESISPG